MRATAKDQRPYVVTGRVAGAGTVTAGTGFTVTRAAVGVYTVRLDLPMRSFAVVTTADWGSAFLVNAQVDETSRQFTARVMNSSSGALTDVPWTFIAQGLVA